MNTQNDLTRPSLAALIEDIIDKARNKDKKAKGASIYYNRKLNKKGNTNNKVKKSKKGRLYKNYKNLNIFYKLENYFIINKKL